MRIALIQQHATREKRVNVARPLDALRRAPAAGSTRLSDAMRRKTLRFRPGHVRCCAKTAAGRRFRG